MDDELAAKEIARIKRRDRDAEAEARALMRPGMGKVFKQILDTQAEAAKEAKAAKAARPASRRERGKPRA
ncbi:MAG TPA: hypothetical protein VEO91_11925 [Candidatus Limnocylindria bacterium]|nr:hypothetical protein [Candidatus Limnocylindria bacterium]